MVGFNVFHVLVDQVSFCDIMCARMYGTLGFEKILRPYYNENLLELNGSNTKIWGYVELPNALSESEQRKISMVKSFGCWI